MEAILNLTAGQFLSLQLLNNVGRYFLIAGLAYLIFWKWGFKKFQKYFLYKEMPKQEDLRREIFFSVLSTIIFIIPSLFIVLFKDQLPVQLYWKVNERGMAWYLASWVVVFFLHDTYFYWTHRLMHHKRLYKYFHHVHHLSKKPTPLAAFAFHPLEALVETTFFAILVFVLPVHFSVVVLFTLFSLFMNVYGHLGFSLFSREKLEKFPLNILSHSTHHSWHHQYYKGNYGFYLRFWDKVMGTWKGELNK